MKHRYLPMTEQDKQDMLDVVGVSSVDELFEDIPEKVRFKGLYDIKEAKSESALLKSYRHSLQKIKIQMRTYHF